jgi:hypothetical protein
MADVSLATFIGEHRNDLIGRCRGKVAERSSPPPSQTEPDYGVPLLLIQLAKELRSGPAHTDEISGTARAHGRQLLQRGFTIDQVVRDYGDVCQSITEMAVETETAISPDDFRTLNRCLDDAIAGAVTEFAKDQDIGRDHESSELWSLVNSASAAFEALQSGSVGVSGATGAVLRRSLENLRVFVDRRDVNAAQRRPGTVARMSPERRSNVRGS